MTKAKENVKKTASPAQKAAPSEPERPRTELQLDDTKADVHYSSSVHIRGSAEEIVLDFSREARPGRRPNTAVLDIDAKIILSPWAAKRLALDLVKTVQQYESTFGLLEVDARKRAEAQKALTKS